MSNHRHVKLYENTLHLLFPLNRGAWKVFLYIMDRIEPGNVTVWLIEKECMESVGIRNRKSYYRAINRLVDCKVLTKTPRKGIYHLNERIFSKAGNRDADHSTHYVNDHHKPRTESMPVSVNNC